MNEGHFEAKKHAYRQTQDGVVVSFVVHPSDISQAIAMAPLGTRFVVAFAEIGDDEKPIEIRTEDGSERFPSGVTVPRPQADKAGISKPKKRFEDLSLVQQCAIRCEDASFTAFLRSRRDYPQDFSAADIVRQYCGVKSRADIPANPFAIKLWQNLSDEYQSWLTDQRHAESIRR